MAESMRDITADVAMNPFDIGDDIDKQSALVSYWVEQVYKAEVRCGDEKVHLEAYEAELYCQIRERNIIKGVKLTEASIEREMKRQPNWVNRKREIVRQEAEVSRLKGHVKSLEQKKCMIELKAHNMRQELRSLGKAA